MCTNCTRRWWSTVICFCFLSAVVFWLTVCDSMLKMTPLDKLYWVSDRASALVLMWCLSPQWSLTELSSFPSRSWATPWLPPTLGCACQESWETLALCRSPRTYWRWPLMWVVGLLTSRTLSTQSLGCEAWSVFTSSVLFMLTACH